MSNALILDILTLLTPEQGGFFVQDIPNGGGRPRNLTLVPDVAGLAREAELRSTPSEYSVFFTPNGFRPLAPARDTDQVLACRSLYLDVDTDPSGQKEVRKGVFADCYATKQDAFDAITTLCDTFGTPHPTTVVDSGRGLHLYWRLSQDVPRDYWEGLGRRLKAHVGALDPRLTVDTTRGATAHDYMRLPGTVNTKASPAVTVWYFEGSTLRPDVDCGVMDAALPAIDGHSATSSGFSPTAKRSMLSVDLPDDHLRSPTRTIAHGCAQLGRLLLDPVARNSHDGWKTMIHALAWSDDRDEAIALAMRLSDTTKGGGEKELLNYISGEQVSKPPTCQTLAYALGDMTRQGCAACPLYASSGGGGTFLRGHIERTRIDNVRAHTQRVHVAAVATAAPVAHLVTAPVQPVQSAAGPVVVQPSTDDALIALLVSALPGDEQFPATCFPAAAHGSDPWVSSAVRPIQMPSTSGVAVGDLTYSASANAVLATKLVRKDEDGQAYVDMSPVVPEALVWVHSKHAARDRNAAMLLTLAIARGDMSIYEYRLDTVTFDEIGDPKALMARLAKCHVIVNAKAAATMSDGLIRQAQRMGAQAAVSSFGWISMDDTDAAFSACGALITPTGTHGALPTGDNAGIMLKHGITGTLNDELALMRTVRRGITPTAAAAYLMALGSMLMRWTPGKVVMLTLAGTSGAGKSTALKAAQSPWGLIGDGYELTGNASNQAPERVYETYRDTGLRVDEMTTRLLDAPGSSIVQQVMNMSSGQARVIAGRAGGVNETRAPFSGVHLSTSNKSLLAKLAAYDGDLATVEAAQARVIETYSDATKPVFNLDAAGVAHVNALADACGGRIGILFAQHVLTNYAATRARVKGAYQNLHAGSNGRSTARFTVAACTVMLVASEVLNTLFPAIWDLSETEVMDIIERLSIESAERRDTAGPDPAAVALSIFYDLPAGNAWMFHRSRGGALTRQPRRIAPSSTIKISGEPGEPLACIGPGYTRAGADARGHLVLVEGLVEDHCRKHRMNVTSFLQSAMARGVLDTSKHTDAIGVAPVMTDMVTMGTQVGGKLSPDHRPAYHFLVDLKGRGNAALKLDAAGDPQIQMKEPDQ